MSVKDSVTRKCLLIITGVSGAGKTTISRSLQRMDSRFVQVVAVTTRTVRCDDEPGTYVYLSEAEFDGLERDGTLLVRAEYRGCRYGISQAHLRDADRPGKIPVMLITPESARVFMEKQSRPGRVEHDIISLFLDAPDAALDKRLEARTGRAVGSEVRAQRNFDRGHVASCSNPLQNVKLQPTLRAILQIVDQRCGSPAHSEPSILTFERPI